MKGLNSMRAGINSPIVDVTKKFPVTTFKRIDKTMIHCNSVTPIKPPTLVIITCVCYSSHCAMKKEACNNYKNRKISKPRNDKCYEAKRVKIKYPLVKLCLFKLT